MTLNDSKAIGLVNDQSEHGHVCNGNCDPVNGVHFTVLHGWKIEGDQRDPQDPPQWWFQVAEVAGYGELVRWEPVPEASFPVCGPPTDPRGRVVVHEGAWRVWYRDL